MELILLDNLRHHTDAPPWFTGWIALIPVLIFGGIFLYYGIRYNKENHEKTAQDEMQPMIFRVMSWWFFKLFLIFLGIFIFGIGFGYIINVPEHFF
jgi:membrane protein insertase Oxa1/YidC/SpoIIIJ